MKHLIDKAAVVAEIENKIAKYTKRGEESDAKRDGYGMYWGGVLSCLNGVRSFLDTLEVKEVQEESVSKDLEKAAEQDACEVINTCSATGIPNDHIPSWVQDAMINEFIHGAKWKERQMMKDVVLETTIVRDSDGNMEDETYQEWLEYEANEIFNVPSWAKEGDKVKILVIKQE